MPNRNLPKTKHQSAFYEAENFYSASMYIQDKANKVSISSDVHRFIGEMVVGEVNHSFAIEMYLKCLQLFTLGERKGGHHLGNLFDKLPADIKSKLNDRYKTKYLTKDEEVQMLSKLCKAVRNFEKKLKA